MLDYGNATRTGPSQKPPMAISFHYTTVYTRLPEIQSRSEKKKGKETVETKEFQEFIVHQSVFLRFPLNGSRRDICNKERRGSGASNQGFSFCQFFCAPPFHHRLFTFG